MEINSDIFTKGVAQAADKKLLAGVWERWPDYTLKSGRRGRYVEAQEPDLGPLPVNEKGELASGVPEDIVVRRARIRNERWPYQPLVEKPYLFLEFARLADDGGLDKELDTEKNAEAAREWAMEHGTLGLTTVKRHKRVVVSTRGGTDDTVASFAKEAWAANGVLKLYEAATRLREKGEVDVEAIAPFIASQHKDFYTSEPRTARQWALEKVANAVQESVAPYTYPALYQQPDGNFIQGWDFTNLLGAMWLQMFWLLIANRERRCKNSECRRIITYEQPEQGNQGLKRNDRSAGYSTRKDRVFCSRKCRNRYDYLEYVRARRQASYAH